MDKKVSVIIPVYNVKPEYIQEAIDSVLNQTYKNIEIIIVDDGSTNSETLEYLQTINNDKIQIINQENKCPGGARNTGINSATGDYLSFLDSDDWLDNNFYETLVNLCEKNDADIACGTMTRVTPKKQKSMDNFKNITVSKFTDKMKFVSNGSISSKLFKKSIFDTIRFVENRYYEDNLVLTELMLASKKVAFTNKVRYWYRENLNSLCMKKDKEHEEKMARDGLYVFKKIYDLDYKTQKNKEASIYTFLPILISIDLYENDSIYKEELDSLLGNAYRHYLSMPTKNSFIENIFSLKNSIGKTHKVITVLGIKIKLKRKKK